MHNKQLRYAQIIIIITALFAQCYGQETNNQPARPSRPDRAEMRKLMDKSISPQAYFIHDPVMIKHSEHYYVFSTNDGIKISRSTDMKIFERIGRVFDQLPTWMPEHIRGINSLWAPDISYRDGLYYLYYSASSFGSRNSLIGLTVNSTLDSSDPNYKWQDKGIIWESSDSKDYNAIDPAFITDPQSGRHYLAFGSFWGGIKLIEVNKDGLAKDKDIEPVSLAKRPGNALEAPFIIHRHDWYYLFVSFDLCCKGADSTYNIRVGRSKDIAGPYFDKNGTAMLEGGGTLVLAASETDRWKGPGHNAIFQENGQDFLIYHAYDANMTYGPSALHIRQLNWDDENWPQTGNEIKTSIP